MSHSSDRYDQQRKPKSHQPAPGQRQPPKPGDWVNALKQIRNSKK